MTEADPTAEFARLLAEGVSLLKQGRHAEAVAPLRAAAQHDPNQAKALNLLGLALWQAGRKAEAETALRQAVTAAPGVALYHLNLAQALHDLGQTAAAAAAARHALELDANLADAWRLLGDACTAPEHLPQAIEHYQTALRLRPADVETLASLGAVCLLLKRLEEAVAYSRRAQALQPEHVGALSNLGAALMQLGRLEEAEDALEQAYSLQTANFNVLSNLAYLRARQHRHIAAIDGYRQALAIRPDAADAHLNLGNALLECCRIDEGMNHLRRAIALKAAGDKPWQILLYAANYHPDWSPEQILDEYRRWAATQPQAGAAAAFANGRDPERRLRIGYVSSDFRAHACHYFVEPLFAAHDAENFEVYAYSDTARPDTITQRLKRHVAHWRDTARLGHDELQALIAADGIDILVDLAGHTAENRMPVFARRAAPIQMTWLGYGHTTGLPGMDYFLTDPWLLPQEADSYITETPWRLPRVAFAYRPPADTPPPGPLPARRCDHVTFGSLTRPVRLNEQVIAAWARILAAVPGSRLRLDQRPFEEAAFREMFLVRFARHGISADRLDLVCTRPHWDAYREIDIALDPFPHNAGTTTLDALWMGVPVLSLAGRPPLGRFGATLLHAVGLDDWVVNDIDAYVARAVAAAADRDALARLRSGLRQRMQASPLLDEAGFARALEAGYRAMWLRCCENAAAAPLKPVQGNRPMSADSKSKFSRLLNQGSDLLARGKFAAAADKLCAALTFAPADAKTLDLLGQALWQSGRKDEAKSAFRQAVAAAPQVAGFHVDLARTLFDLGRADEAVAAAEAAIALDSQLAEPWLLLGNVCAGRKDLPGAIERYQTALRLRPAYIDAHVNLGAVLIQSKQMEAAVVECRKALEFKPDHPDALSNMGAALAQLSRLDEAQAALERVVARYPDFVGALCNLGYLRTRQQRFIPAIELYSRALAIAPDFADARQNIGNSLLECCRIDEAMTHLRTAMTLQPGDDKPWQLLLYAANYHPDWSTGQILDEYRRWAASQAPAVDTAAFANAPEPQRRLRIGYVSPDFRGHACVYFIEPLLAAHDAGQFEVFAYSDTERPDAITRRLRPQVAHWRDTSRLSDQELHALIVADGIDILVDLAGHTSGNRMLVFARRAAPIQMTWLGYGHTTGLASVDYFLTDPWMLPAGAESAIVESPWRLPRIAYTYRPPEKTPEPGPLPAQRNGYLTFGSLTRTVRLNEHVIAAWARILAAVPGSRLRLDQLPFEEAAFRKMFLERFNRHGISAERLDFTCTRPHWNAYQEIDIALDPFPHNAGTTTLDALWMGVPVLSLIGRPPLGRFGVALLHAVGLDDWAVDDVDAYVARAAEAASDLDALAVLRQSLRLRLQASPLLDEAGFARALESGYRTMWRQWCEGSGERQERVVVSRMLQAAIKLHQAGSLEQAAELYRLILQLQPDQGDALNLLGAIAQQCGDYAQAEALGRQAVQAMPDFAAGHGNHGSALAALGRTDAAVAAFRRAVELDPGYVEAHFKLANALQALHRRDEAVAEFRTTVAVRPDHFRAWLGLGKLLLAEGDRGAAEAAIREAIALQPEDVEARHVLAAILFETGRREAARAEIDKAMQLRPEFAAVLQQDWSNWCTTLKETQR